MGVHTPQPDRDLDDERGERPVHHDDIEFITYLQRRREVAVQERADLLQLLQHQATQPRPVDQCTTLALAAQLHDLDHSITITSDALRLVDLTTVDEPG